MPETSEAAPIDAPDAVSRDVRQETEFGGIAVDELADGRSCLVLLLGEGEAQSCQASDAPLEQFALRYTEVEGEPAIVAGLAPAGAVAIRTPDAEEIEVVEGTWWAYSTEPFEAYELIDADGEVVQTVAR